VEKSPGETTILTDAQVRSLTRDLRDMLIASFPHVAWSRRDLETGIRMMAMCAKCKETRQKRNLSIKEVAAELRVPQYRIKAIEKPSMTELRPESLRAYVELLGLKRWSRRWVAANVAVAKRLGVDDL
jgi:hypothetical protein